MMCGIANAGDDRQQIWKTTVPSRRADGFTPTQPLCLLLLSHHDQSKNGEVSSSTFSVEATFQQIMTAVHKSNTETAELRQEYQQLKIANAALEHQVREQVQGGAAALPSHGLPLFAPTPLPAM
ncbi:hypothetical protein BS47DRAFT_21712 [Hydnum rufescens UP504]|uniref:Uncharacterized protein n=1 Tax=Hydnum rufescens UP504 TaxID=1448309 RepID=A0A9P6BAJ5_9AGAM|nr:hypothetical protein BS47DRAFT_21712 [Hydnum rufescens UP504]